MFFFFFCFVNSCGLPLETSGLIRTVKLWVKVSDSVKYRVVSDWKGLLLLYIQKCELLVLNID